MNNKKINKLLKVIRNIFEEKHFWKYMATLFFTFPMLFLFIFANYGFIHYSLSISTHKISFNFTPYFELYKLLFIGNFIFIPIYIVGNILVHFKEFKLAFNEEISNLDNKPAGQKREEK